jgi:hypothetical protein
MSDIPARKPAGLKNVPIKFVQRLPRNADAPVRMDIYSHLNPDMRNTLVT